MKVTKSNRFFFLYILYFLVAVGAYGAFYWHISSKDKGVVETRSEIEVLREQNDATQNLKQLVRETSEGREKLESFFVDSGQIIEFLERIESLGETANVSVDVKSINETDSKSERVKNLLLSIDVEGDLGSVHHFLALLENIPIQMTIDRFSLREFTETVVIEEGEERREEEVVKWRGNISLRTLQLVQ